MHKAKSAFTTAILTLYAHIISRHHTPLLTGNIIFKGHRLQDNEMQN